ncbi:MAG: NUDIX domain-containing protein [Planctomycetaceae bacterium]|nr:NUDIX domain-containing protein [Planctomycetaceae bacterium]
MSEELFDICDEHDNVIGQAPRSHVHAHNLLHRAVHIWAYNSAGELMIHLRSSTKDQYPNCYTSSASGHVDAGEDYETAAYRELSEELQLAGALEYVGKLPAGPATAYEHTVLYRLTTDATPQPDPAEIATIEFHPVERLLAWVEREPQRFTPPLRELLSAFAE